MDNITHPDQDAKRDSDLDSTQSLTQSPAALTREWVQRVVVGINLCPFAEPSISRGGLDLKVSAARDLESAYRDTLIYLDAFLEPASDHFDSGLIVFPDALADFEEFLECLTLFEEALETLGLEGVLQCASFHPHYRFAGEPEDDQAHWSNRSPLPTLHLLREERVSAVIDTVPHPEKIPARNIARLRAYSPDALRQLFAGLTIPPQE